MASRPDHQSLPGTTALAGFDPIIFAFIDDLRVREGIAGKHVGRFRGTARHFLAWLGLSGIALETVDCTAIERFLQHDCECCAGVPASGRVRGWAKRGSWPPLMAFVRFLERTGRIETPGELDDNLQLLDAFLEHMRADGYASGTIGLHRQACANLIAWLHFARIRLHDLNPDAYARFRNREFICSIPGVFYGQGICTPGGCFQETGGHRLQLEGDFGSVEPVHPLKGERGIQNLVIGLEPPTPGECFGETRDSRCAIPVSVAVPIGERVPRFVHGCRERIDEQIGTRRPCGHADGISKSVAEGAVDSVLAAIGEALAKDEDVRIAGFGKFATRSRPARAGRNPQIGESVAVPASTVPSFKAGKALKDALNR